MDELDVSTIFRQYDGRGAQARFGADGETTDAAMRMAADHAGNLFVADRGENAVLVVSF